MAWAEGTVLNDKYIIAKEIGNGGFGLTYLAYKSDRITKVAIKTLKDAYAFDPILHDEFKKEILSLSKCNHPQIVTIEDFGDYKSGWLSQKSQPYMVMEYIKGQTVFEKMRSRQEQGKSPQFSENDALFYIRQVASALVFAHDRHPPILHRDLKPQNIMLREDRPEAVLIDFGLARDIAANPVSTAKLTFSSGFAPIEQYSYKPIRLPATDVYGLAATLYYMLTAKVPTDANDRAQGKQLINPKQHNPNISEQTCQAIVRGLEFKLENRPETMNEWLDLLPLNQRIPLQIQHKKAPAPDIKVDEKTTPAKAEQHKNLLAPQNKHFFVVKIALVFTIVTLFAVSFYRRQDGTCFFSFNPLCEMATDRQKLAQNFYNDGLKKYNNKDFNGAIADYKKATEIKPDYADAYMELGNVYSDRGENQNAFDNYTKVIAYNPNSAQAYNRRGYITLKLANQQPNGATEVINNLEKSAIDDYSKAINLQPDYALPYNNRGAFYQLKGDHLKAIKDFDLAIKYDPKYALAYYNRALSNNALNKHIEAVADFKDSIRLDPNHLDSYYELGKKFIDHLQYSDAVKILDKLVSLNSNYINAYYYRALAKYKLGDKNGAILDYNKYIEVESNDDKAYFERGLAKYDLGNKEGAIADFDKSLKIRPDYNTYYYRGKARYDSGEKDKAIADYNEAIRLKPDYAEAYYNRGDAKFSIDKQGAINDYTEAIRIKPDFTYAYHNRGSAKVNVGDQQGAINDYTEAIRLKPDYADAYHNRGDARFNLGDKQAAVNDYTEAIRIKPDFPNPYYRRGLIKKERGDKEALTDFRKALELYQQQGNTEWSNNSRDRIKELGG